MAAAAAKCDYSTAYDRMMAEIQLDSDEEEPHMRRASERAMHLGKASTSARGITTTTMATTQPPAERKPPTATRNGDLRHRSANETKLRADSSSASEADRNSSTGATENDSSASAKSDVQEAPARARTAQRGGDNDSDSSGNSDADQEGTLVCPSNTALYLLRIAAWLTTTGGA